MDAHCQSVRDRKAGASVTRKQGCSSCARAFRVKYNQAHGILEATAVTAVPMSADQTARLHEKLEAVTGKTIDLRTKVDAAVLGGIRLDIEGTELDGTVKNRLASLRRSIAGITV